MNYNTFLSKLEHVKKGNGENQHTARCPAHNDKSNSLAVNLDGEKITLHCFAGCKNQDIVKSMNLKMKNLFINEIDSNQGSQAPKKFNIENFAKEKGFTEEFLKSCGVVNDNWYKEDAIGFLYTGGRKRIRRNRIKKDEKFRWDGKEEIVCYKPIKYELDYIYIVEGETDTLSFLYNKMPALGIPGATMTGKLKKRDIEGIKKIYICQEPDMAGKSFVASIANTLREMAYSGELYKIDMMAHLKVKDANELHQKSYKFKESMAKATKNAEEVDILQDGYIEIGQQEKFCIYKDKIIYLMEKRYRGGEIFIEEKIIINQKVKVVEVYRDLFTDQCEVMLQWGKNKKKKFPLEVLLVSSKHGELAKHGILSDSNNSKHLVTYFNACISELIKKEKKSAKQNGWLEDGSFVYGGIIVTADNKEVIEFECEYKPEQKGKLEKQIKLINELIEDEQIALVMGSAATSPISNLLGVENKTHHTCGDSSRGKSTASKLSASLFFHPTINLNSWKSSQAGLETIFEEAGGLPVFLEESHRAHPEKVVEVVYSFGNRKKAAKGQIVNGKLTRRKACDMQGTIISTGESAISSLTSYGGATARIIEQHKIKVEQLGYAEKIERVMAELEENYGHFGLMIVEYYLNNKEAIKEKVEEYKEIMREHAAEGLQYRQIPYFALSLAGCDILRELGLKMPNYADLLQCCLDAMADKPQGLYEKAIEHVLSSVDVARNNFIFRKYEKNYVNGTTSIITQQDHIKNNVYGMVDATEQKVHIYTKYFNSIMNEEKMSRQSVLQAFDEKNMLEKKKGKTNRVYIDGGTKNVITIKLPPEFHFKNNYISNDEETYTEEEQQEMLEEMQTGMFETEE